MSVNANRSEVMAFVRSVIANDYDCDADDFLNEGYTFKHTPQRPGGRGYIPPSKTIQATSFGYGIVLTCHPDFFEPIKAITSKLDRDDFFYPMGLGPLYNLATVNKLQLRGPSLKHALSRDRFTPAGGFEQIAKLIETDQVLALANTPGFSNALEPSDNRLSSNYLAGVVYDNERLIAAAAAVEEAPGFWQIGVDVLPDARKRGLGLAVVSRVSAAILERGDVPYYSADPANIASRSIAHALGFFPAFTEIHCFNAPQP